jgi:hypothetical protein
MNCNNCGGSGRTTCHACSGGGTETNTGPDGSTQVDSCFLCAGSGKETCSSCLGTGGGVTPQTEAEKKGEPSRYDKIIAIVTKIIGTAIFWGLIWWWMVMVAGKR